MSGGGSVNFQTPTPLYEAENQIFGSLPWANTGGAMYNAYNAAGNLTSPTGLGGQQGNVANAGNNLVNQASTLTNNLFNNQQGYYNQLQQQNTDQANAENAMAGVATTPYGAALTNQSNLNFNNQWQSFLNGQQNTVANTIGSLMGTGSGAIQQSANNQQTQFQDYLNYLLGNTQNSSAYTNAVNASTNAGAASTSSLAQAQQANNAGKSGIGSAIGGIGSLVGNLIS